jgi:predicted nuclease of predicted toxin-antitoxin system
MDLALYMDVHVPLAITRGLRRRGVDVLSAQEDGRRRVADPLLLDRATALDRVVFTRDKDFLAIAQARQVSGVPFAGVVYAAQQSVSIGQCVQDLEIIALASLPGEMLNTVKYLPLR